MLPSSTSASGLSKLGSIDDQPQQSQTTSSTSTASARKLPSYNSFVLPPERDSRKPAFSNGSMHDAMTNPDPPRQPPSKDHRSMVIFSGGSAANHFVFMFQAITDNICYILPVSDDGGSTSEIVKVVGGPGIGDIRSRLVRLAETKTLEAKAVHDLLSYRLPTDLPTNTNGNSSPAKNEWHDIVEGTHPLWTNISLPYRETIRAFLLQFHYKILKQVGQGPMFDFRGGSLGNFFLTGCRLFFDSLEAAIFQFARITRAPSRTDVMSIIATNRNTVAIAANLRNGNLIVGQCEISHPGHPTGIVSGGAGATGIKGLHPLSAANSSFDITGGFRPSTHGTPVQSRRNTLTSQLLKQQLKKSIDTMAVASTSFPGTASINLPFPMSLTSSAASSSSNLIFSKNPNACPPLASPIRRIFYVNPERRETFPKLNVMAPMHLIKKRTIIYSMGSLYTSIIPCLIVPGVGRLIADDYILDDDFGGSDGEGNDERDDIGGG
ncbi:hypothetical protein HDU76_005057, partial [Blyttiomyces sp. JEL0837]